MNYTASHLSGISWNVPSGSVRLIVMGKTPISSSLRAISIGLFKPVPPLERLSSRASKIGAPMEIWSERAPTIRAFSKRVIFGGPTVTFSAEGDSLVTSHSAHTAFHARRHSATCPHWGGFHFLRCNYVIDSEN